MRKLIVVICIVAGVWYWQTHKASSTVALDESGKPVVVVFTTNGCDPCKTMVDTLTARGVPFRENEIDPSDEQDEDVKLWRSLSGNMLPLTVFGDSKVKGASKWELIGLLGDNFGDQYLTPEEQTYFSRHFDANGSPKVALYGTDWCPTCAQLRKDLQENGVEFADIDVEKSGDFDRLTRVMEIPGYPAVWVGYTRVYGTNFNAVKAVMN